MAYEMACRQEPTIMEFMLCFSNPVGMDDDQLKEWLFNDN
jgi:hypothetical protein